MKNLAISLCLLFTISFSSLSLFSQEVSSTASTSPASVLIDVPVKPVAVPSSCVITPPRQLKKGLQDKGSRDDILKLQKALFGAGYLKATPNGYFGEGTHAAVRALQKKNGLSVTGIVGPYTLAKINELSCKETSQTEKPVTASSTQATTETKKPVVVSTEPSPKNEGVAGVTDGPVISLFSVGANSAGVTTYSAKIRNVDAVSVKATCPQGVVEVKSSVGLTKVKIPANDSVCAKEKYLYLSDLNKPGVFERANNQMVYIGRDGLPGWFAIDSSTTLPVTTVQYKVKACLATTCVEKVASTPAVDYLQKIVSTDLSLESVRVDADQKLYVTARNFNQITVRAGCPYNTQAIDANGAVLTDDATPCNVEKDIVAKQMENSASYDKPEGVDLKTFGFNFELKPVNGQTDMFSNIELTVKACTGVQAETVSSTTLKCAEKKTYLPVYKK